MTFEPLELDTLLLILSVLWFTYGVFVGSRRGQRLERLRCGYLYHQVILQSGAGSVRRVWNAISSGADLPLSEDEFFGPRRSDEPEVH